MTTEYPLPTELIWLKEFNAFVHVYAYGIDDVTFHSEGIEVNRIPVEFRAYFKRGQGNDHWFSTDLFAYRLDKDDWIKTRATQGQQTKLYAALRSAIDDLPASFLLDGQDAALGREIEQLEVDIDRKKIEVAELVNKKRTLQTQYETAALNK